MTTASRATARTWAYVGIVLGGGVSIAANIAHSFVPPVAAGPGWHPQTGAVVGAVFWPIALFVAVEILTRTPWPTGARWVLLRFAGLLPVALVAAVVSYRHLSGLLTFYGEDRLTVTIGPGAVDGLMVMATGALLATGARLTTKTTTTATVPNGRTEAAPVPDRPTTPTVIVAEPWTNTAQPPRPAPTVPVSTVDSPASTVDAPDRPGPLPPIPADLLTAARTTAHTYRAQHGRDITHDALRDQLRVSNATAVELLRTLRATPTPPVRINGTDLARIPT